MELVYPPAEDYASRFTTSEDELIAVVAAATYARHPHAHMLSGHVQGSFLTILSSLLQPERILEIGTFTGYSALCLAKGLTATGTLHTIEVRNEDAAIALKYFKQSANADKIHLHIGEAKQVIASLKEAWDIVFIDADKTGYIDYYELILPSVRKNGLIIADNVLFHGQVLASPITGKNALAINDFNKQVLNDPRVEQVLLTVRDGLLIIRKL